jgi:hypothetical protein
MLVVSHSFPRSLFCSLGLITACGCSGTSGPKEENSTHSQTSPSNSSTSTSTGDGQSTSTASGASTAQLTDDVSDATSSLKVELMWDDLTYPCSLRHSGQFVFACDRRQFLGEPSRVLALPKSGGEPRTIVELERADAVAVNESVWVLDTAQNRISRFNVEDGSLEGTVAAEYYTSTLFNAPTGVLGESHQGLTWYDNTSTSGHTLWTTVGEEEIWLLATNATSVYFTVNPPYPAPRGSAYKVMGLDVDFASGTAASAPREITSGIGSGKGIAVTSDAVIYADNHNDKLYSVTFDGVTKTLLAEVSYPWSIGVNSTHVYIASRPEECSSEGAVYRVPLTGGALQTIATGQICPSNVIVTETEVYWLNAGPEQPSGDPPMVTGSYASIMGIKL